MPLGSIAASRTGTLVIALGGVLLLAASTFGQSQGRRSFVSDDGEQTAEFHYRPPNLERLAEPDFDRSDMPAFEQRLALDEGQRLFVETRLHAYLLSFQALVADALPKPEEQLGVIRIDQMAGEGESIADLIRNAVGAEDDEYELGGETRVSIMIGAGDGAGPMRMGGGEPELDEGEIGVTEDIEMTAEMGADGEVVPQAEVSIGIQTPDGEEIPEEVRAQLQERARELAEQIKAQIEEGIANGDAPFLQVDAGEQIAMRKEHADEVAAQAADFRRRKSALRRGFTQDVQAQLTPDQVDRWPGLERLVLRNKTLPWGELDGEKTDLTKIVERTGLDEMAQTSLAASMEEYEKALHGALIARNDFLAESDAKIDEALWEGRHDDAIKVVDKGSKLRAAVRDVNGRHADVIVARLDDESAARFRQLAMERSFPRVYRRNPGVRAFETARGFEDLDPEIAVSIEELDTLYQSELERVNERLRDTIVRYQPEEAGLELARQVGMIELDDILAGPGRTHPKIAEAFAKRSQLDQTYLRRLRGLLTPEQAAALPQIRMGKRRGGNANEPLIIHETAGGNEPW